MRFILLHRGILSGTEVDPASPDHRTGDGDTELVLAGLDVGHDQHLADLVESGHEVAFML